MVEALAAELNHTSPDLIAISGDLTQRARIHEFKAARAFFDRLPQPSLVVPGNHDVPANPLRRFIAPWRTGNVGYLQNWNPWFVQTISARWG